MPTVYLSARLGRAVVVLDAEHHYLLDVENDGNAVECPPSFIRTLCSTASDVALQTIAEEPPFPATYATLLRDWQRERTTTMVLLALDKEMPAALRATSAQIANQLLGNADCLATAQSRLFSSPLPEDADLDGVPQVGSPLRAFLDQLRARQQSIQLASDAWSRARTRVAEYSSWAAELREITVGLGGFAVMSEAMEAGVPDSFDDWLTHTVNTHPRTVSQDLLSILLAWKNEAFERSQVRLEPVLMPVVAAEAKGQGIDEFGRELTTLLQPQDAGLSTAVATSPSSIADFLRKLRKHTLPQGEVLSTFLSLAPDWLRSTAEEQGRTLQDLVHDLIRAGSLNFAGITELALQQHKFPDLREVWVFAQRPLDLEQTFYSAVRHNIKERFVKYYYFVSDPDFFLTLRARLIREIPDPAYIDSRVFCKVMPEETFLLSPGIGLMIPGDLEKIQGVHVTSLTYDGNIKEAQSLTREEVRRSYQVISVLIQKHFGQPVRPLPNEIPSVHKRAAVDADSKSDNSVN